MVVDAHNHAQDSRLDSVRAGLAEAWTTAGLEFAVVNGTREEDWDRVGELSAADPRLLASYGLHPWFVDQAKPGWKDRLQLRLESCRAGVGEIGLDHWKAGHDPIRQEDAFLWQFDFAARTNLPASVHCLQAFGRLRELLHGRATPACGWLLHSYGGPKEMVRDFAAMGAYFSFSGYFLHPRRVARLDVFRRVPRDRLLIETDAPDMAGPYPARPFDAGPGLNHPANIRAVLEGLARELGEPVAELEARTTANARRLFDALLPGLP